MVPTDIVDVQEDQSDAVSTSSDILTTTNQHDSQCTVTESSQVMKRGLGDARDPEIEQARKIAAAGGGLSGHTTVTIQQLPYKYTQKRFAMDIKNDGFGDAYDFLYLPVSRKKQSDNCGFGFMNFLSASVAEEFYRRYHGQKIGHSNAALNLQVIPADVQGFEECAKCYFTSWYLRKTRKLSMPLFKRPVTPDMLNSKQGESGLLFNF